MNAQTEIKPDTLSAVRCSCEEYGRPAWGAVIALLIYFAVYLGIGAFCHAAFVGDAFYIGSMMSVGWVLAWPFGLVFVAWKWIVGGVALIVAAALLISWRSTK